MQPQIERYLRLARARFAKGGVAGGGDYIEPFSITDGGRRSGNFIWPGSPGNQGGSIEFGGRPSLEFGAGGGSYWGTNPAAGYHSLYPTSWRNEGGHYGWVPHAQGAGRSFGGSGAGYTTGGYSPLAGAGVGTPGMGGSLMPGAMNSSYDIPKQIHSYNRGGVAQEQDDRTPAWFIEKIGGQLMTPDELDQKWMDWQFANEQARKRAMNEKPYSRGGLVGPVKRPLQGYGRDTVPAALTPGEAVFNRKQLGAIQPRPGHANRLRPDQIMAMAKAGRK